ncbi:MAG TPA: tail fiber protein [Polyangiaceae bacterium]|jgi:microcystin-dependent protein|nr:tail fiber protein [Polyangiaceae bacterium]
MSDVFLGEIRAFPYTFAPNGWALCNGQLLPISQNTALFSLLGTMYGGDGKSTFALPDLRGAVPVHFGQGAGLTARTIGEAGGSETVTLTTAQISPHNHGVAAVSANDITTASATPSATTVFGAEQARSVSSGYVTVGTQASAALSGNAVAATGGGQPHNNMAPFLVFNFCIALSGIFPSRS